MAPRVVELANGTRVPVEQALLMAVAMLATHPGARNPSLGKFVTGREAVTKRLVVIGLEDALLGSDALRQTALAVLITSWMARLVPMWRPSTDLVYQVWFKELALPLLNETRAYSYDKQRGAEADAFSIWGNRQGAKNVTLATCSALLDQLGGFDGDLQMARDIATNMRVVKRKDDAPVVRPACMPVWHALDQHCTPDVAYCFAAEWVPPPVVASKVFEPLFARLFDELTGLNPRRATIDEQQPFFVAARLAQKRYLQLVLGRLPWPSPPAEPLMADVEDEVFSCTHTLDQG